MALPVILVDSSSGSDSQASGAGPSTALFGTTDASTDGTGLIVTLTAGTDLTSVAVDGSHVIFVNDATAGARNFGKITAKAGSGGATPTVTVSNAFGLSLTTKSWAIGGKRASIGSTTSRKLTENNSGSGDAMPGWVIELQSGHSETIAATFTFRRSGDATDGAVVLRGASGAATLPLITCSADVTAITLRANGIRLLDFELRNTAAGKTASIGIGNASGGECLARRIKISHATNYFRRGLADQGNGSIVAEECEIGYCSNVGIQSDSATPIPIVGNYIHDCGSHGILINTSGVGRLVAFNICESNGGDGLNYAGAGADDFPQGLQIFGNTFYNNTSDGIQIAGNNWRTLGLMQIRNNIFANNGAYGINLTTATAAHLAYRNAAITHNAFYLNSSGKYTPSGLTSDSEQTSDPQFTDAANGDFSLGTNLKGLGFPDPVGKYSPTRSYTDIGAAQRQEAGGASGVHYRTGGG